MEEAYKREREIKNKGKQGDRDDRDDRREEESVSEQKLREKE